MTGPANAPAVDVVVTEVIREPISVVAAYASDPINAPQWYAKIPEVEWRTPPPLRVGSEVAFVARFLGRELRYSYAIVEHTPETLVMRTAQGPFPMETSYRFEPTPDVAIPVTRLRHSSVSMTRSRLSRPCSPPSSSPAARSFHGTSVTLPSPTPQHARPRPAAMPLLSRRRAPEDAGRSGRSPRR